MLVTRCTSCGRPTPVSLATPEIMRCTGCGFEGPPPESTVAQLRSAATVLSGLDVKERQLTAKQRRALSGAAWRRWAFRAVFAVVAFPFFVFALLGVWGATRGGLSGGLVAAVLIGPFVIIVAAGAAISRWLRGRRRSLEAVCAAVPPQAPGQPASCHVCGAPLAPKGVDPFCRCGFCDADNLVAPSTLAAMRDRRLPALDAYESEVVAQARGLGAGTTSASVGVVLVGIGAPIGVCTLGFLTALGIFQIEAKPNPAVEHATLSRGGRRCLAQISQTLGDEVTLDFGGAPPAGFERRMTVPRREVALTPISSLVGRTIRRDDGDFRVVRVYGTPLGVNAMVLEGRGGATTKVSIRGECVVDDEK